MKCGFTTNTCLLIIVLSYYNWKLHLPVIWNSESKHEKIYWKHNKYSLVATYVGSLSNNKWRWNLIPFHCPSFVNHLPNIFFLMFSLISSIMFIHVILSNKTYDTSFMIIFIDFPNIASARLLNYSSTDGDINILPLLKKIIRHGTPVWVFRWDLLPWKHIFPMLMLHTQSEHLCLMFL